MIHGIVNLIKDANSPTGINLSLKQDECITTVAELPDAYLEIHVFKNNEIALAFKEGFELAANNTANCSDPLNEILLITRFDQGKPNALSLEDAVFLVNHANSNIKNIRAQRNSEKSIQLKEQFDKAYEQKWQSVFQTLGMNNAQKWTIDRIQNDAKNCTLIVQDLSDDHLTYANILACLSDDNVRLQIKGQDISMLHNDHYSLQMQETLNCCAQELDWHWNFDINCMQWEGSKSQAAKALQKVVPLVNLFKELIDLMQNARSIATGVQDDATKTKLRALMKKGSKIVKISENDYQAVGCKQLFSLKLFVNEYERKECVEKIKFNNQDAWVLTHRGLLAATLSFKDFYEILEKEFLAVSAIGVKTSNESNESNENKGFAR